MAKDYYSSIASADKGKFRLRVRASYSEGNGIVCTCYANITDAFKSEHKYELVYYTYNNTKKTFTQISKKKKTLKKKGNHKLCTFTIPYDAVTKPISLKMAKKTVKIEANTIQATALIPTKMNAIEIDTSNTSFWEIFVTGKGKVNQPVSKCYLEYTTVLNPVDSDFSSAGEDEFPATDEIYESSFEFEIEEGQHYTFRARASSTVEGTELFSPYIYSETITTRPEETSGVSINNDVVSWEADLADIASGVVKGWNIFRRLKEDSMFPETPLATIEAVAGQRYYSWTDPTSAVGRTYYYKVIAYNNAGEAWDSGQTEVEREGDPDAPSTSDFYVYYNASSYARIDIICEFYSAKIERSNDSGTTWTLIAEIFDPTKYYVDQNVSVNSIYRISIKTSQDGNYGSPSTAVQPAQPEAPNPPIIVYPLDGQMIEWTTAQLKSTPFIVESQPVDGSPITTTVDAMSYGHDDGEGGIHWHNLYPAVSDDKMSMTANFQPTGYFGFEPEGNIYLRARTKTAGGWSDYTTITCHLGAAAPSLTIVSPSGTVSNLPLILWFRYDGAALKYIELTIRDDDGEEIFHEDIHTYDERTSVLNGTINLMKTLFESDREYSIYLTAYVNGNSTTSKVTFVIEYDEDDFPEGGLLPLVSNDPETGYAFISIVRDTGDDDEEVTPLDIQNAYLYRRANGEKELIQEVVEGDEITDYYAPINAEYQYELLQIYGSNKAFSVRVEAANDSRYSFIYWGSRYQNTARAEWNMETSASIERPERQMVRYSGRKYPVVYDSKAREERQSFTCEMQYDDLQDFIDMVQAGGTGIWKSNQGRCFDAAFDIQWEPVESEYKIDLFKVSLSVTRIER